MNLRMIELRGVSKTYGPLRALESIDLSIPQGKTTALIGPSGCGKSTLLRLMAGLITADSGKVFFEGKALDRATVLEARRRMGYVIQDGGLFPHLTARQNVELLPRYLRWPAERLRARTAEVAELTRFPEDGLGRFPAQLSGGQRQRVALMRALMLDPDVLLLDEPLGALDPLIRAELQEDLREIFRTLEKTVVIVTHDLAEAAFFADEIVLLDGGRIVQRGPLRELVDRPVDPFVTRFIRAQRRTLDSLEEASR